MVLEQWFSTPIWYGNFANISEQDYQNAINYCILLSTKNSGRKMSNIGGWQSDDYNEHDFFGTPLQIFIEQIKPSVKKTLLDLGITQDLPLGNIWININDINNKNKPHDHPTSFLSGVFYLTKKNSDIVFYRNRDISDYHLRWYNSNRNTDLSSTSTTYSPKQGQYLLFPAWLIHSVKPHNSTEKRISIAFNI